MFHRKKAHQNKFITPRFLIQPVKPIQQIQPIFSNNLSTIALPVAVSSVGLTSLAFESTIKPVNSTIVIPVEKPIETNTLSTNTIEPVNNTTTNNVVINKEIVDIPTTMSNSSTVKIMNHNNKKEKMIHPQKYIPYIVGGVVIFGVFIMVSKK